MKKNMYRRIICASGFIVFAVLAIGSVDTEKDAKKVQDKAAEFTVMADHLYSAYDQNQVSAEREYKGKVGIISGQIQDIGREITGKAYVILGGNGLFNGVQCTFPESQDSAIATLSKGQYIKVKAEITGKMGHVQAKNASLQ